MADPDMAESQSHAEEKAIRPQKAAKRKGTKRKGAHIPSESKEIEEIRQKCLEEIDENSIAEFTDFPLSSKTQKGLAKGEYVSPTLIQRQGIALALRGLDVLGAAKTGSGKTLAFLVPILELLWKEKFTSMDGLGALIISPTRELAYQTFEVLRKIGKFHTFSAGLIIGGKSIEEEQARILNTNIIVCTPGRLLQHMDETPNFDCNNLRVLVLDEADRILDLGFAQTMNAIIENLPAERQTMLYSATQTKSVKDLARLSLSDPQYIAVHEKAAHSTPKTLTQYYAVCELTDKVNFLYSFVKNHLKSKIIVFMSSCKQVKFLYEVFRRLRPGIPLMALYGKQKQLKRMGIYEQFCRKANAVLLATDIAARGLDFPEVHWVVQLDCPEDVNTYIHRVGRTARLEKDGKALLVLLKYEEEEMTKELLARKIPILEIKPDPKKIQNVQKKLASFCAQSQEMKHWAQRSIVSYVRSVFLQSNKKIFDINNLPIQDYAKSIGLLAPPRIRFMKKLEKRIGNSEKEAEKDRVIKESMKKQLAPGENESEESDSETEIAVKKAGSDEVNAQNGNEDDTDSIDDVLVLKNKQPADNINEDELDPDIDIGIAEETAKHRQKSKVTLAKKITRKGIKANTKLIFGDDGEAHEVKGPVKEAEDDSEAAHLRPVDIKSFKKTDVGGIDIRKMKTKLGRADKVDRQAERNRIKRKHKEMKLKNKQGYEPSENGLALLSMPEEEESQKTIFSENEEEEDEETSKTFNPPVSKKKKRSKIETFDNQDNLQDDEELALHLLSGV